MKSIVKLFGISSCCLVGSVAAANAEPTVLADAELDRVAAGLGLPGPGNFGIPFDFGGVPPGDNTFSCAAIGCRPGEPGYPHSGGPVPVEPPGCETGACGPLDPFPTLEPIAPIELSPRAPVPPSLFPPIEPILISRLFGGCGGPAATCPGIGF